MEIIKILKDYTKSPLEEELNNYLSQQLDSTLCREKIKNKDFIIKSLKPLNNFIISTTALPRPQIRKVL